VRRGDGEGHVLGQAMQPQRYSPAHIPGSNDGYLLHIVRFIFRCLYKFSYFSAE